MGTPDINMAEFEVVIMGRKRVYGISYKNLTYQQEVDLYKIFKSMSVDDIIAACSQQIKE